MPWTVTYAWDSMDPNPTVVTFEDEWEAIEWATEEMSRRIDYIVQHSQYSLNEEDVREIEESESALLRIQSAQEH